MKYRQLLRFRLRTLLILFTILSFWLAKHVTNARHQEEAVNAIREYGGWVRYDFQYPSGRFSHKDFDSKAKSWMPKWALNRLGFDFFHDVVFVSLNYSEDSGKREENHNPSDDALQHLPMLPNLRLPALYPTCRGNGAGLRTGRVPHKGAPRQHDDAPERREGQVRPAGAGASNGCRGTASAKDRPRALVQPRHYDNDLIANHGQVGTSACPSPISDYVCACALRLR